MEETQSSSNAYTYAPVDPFKPSIAFSLRKLSAQEDSNLLEDDRPPIRRRPQSRPIRGAYAPAYLPPGVVYYPERTITPPRPRFHYHSPARRDHRSPIPPSTILMDRTDKDNHVRDASPQSRHLPRSRYRSQSRPSRTEHSPAYVPPRGPYTQARFPGPSRSPPRRARSHSRSRSSSPRCRSRSRSRSYSPRRCHGSPMPAPSPTLSLTEGTDKESQVQDHDFAPLVLPLNPGSSHHSASPSTASAQSRPRARQYEVSSSPVTPPKARSTSSKSPSPPPRPADDVDSSSSGSPRLAVRVPRPAYDLSASPEVSQSSMSCSLYDKSESSASAPPENFPPRRCPLPPPAAPAAPAAAAPLPRRDYLELSFNNNEKHNAKPPPNKNKNNGNDNNAYAYASAFVLDTLPRQIYLNLLLRLPYLYFSRVTRIFEEAEMSMPMIRQGILDAARARACVGVGVGADGDVRAKGTANANGKEGRIGNGKFREMDPERQLEVERERYIRIGGMFGNGKRREMDMDRQKSFEPDLTMMDDCGDNVGYVNLQTTWLAFVDALLKEWKTLNIISVLLLSAILTLLQIQSIANDPVTRYSALLSMICALISLIYGCIYIIRFGTMKKTYKGAAWAQEAQRQKAGIWWNIWVMLALPATWLAWSVILYITTITAFIWRSSPYSDLLSSSSSSATATGTGIGTPITIPSATSPQLLIPRLLLTGVLAVGVVYSILIASTLRRYGESMDRAWQERIWGWMKSEGESMGMGMGMGGYGYGDVVREVREVCRCEACETGKAGGGGDGDVDDKVRVGDVDLGVNVGGEGCRCETCVGGGGGGGVDNKVKAVNVDMGVGVGDEIGEVCRCETCVPFGPAVDEKVEVVDTDADVDVGVRGHSVGSRTKEWVEDHLARWTNNEGYDKFFINEDVIPEGANDIAGEGFNSKLVGVVSAAEREANESTRREEWPSDPGPLPPIHEHEDEHEDEPEHEHEVQNVLNGSHSGIVPQIHDDISEVLRLRNVVVCNTEVVGGPQGSLSTLESSFVEEKPKSMAPPALTSPHQTDSTAAGLG